jgi:class 3 adenylate cyclase/tetratricopeptide (TPR) repeat protein/ribosomal protein L40E
MPACPNCGGDNPERAKFCLECGTSLAAPGCPNCGAENPPHAKFCLECGTGLVAAAAAAPPAPPAAPVVPDEERKLDTLVFVDLVGSTALAESLDPEDVLGLLELYYARLRAELERNGGTVEKYIGDAIVTHFGVPVAHEDDPERAVRAALMILDTVQALNAEDPIREIQVRIGIATGEVIVTHGNRAEEGKGIAWGDVLNTAARIESAAPVNGILVGETTYRATMHSIEYVDHEPIEAKGKAEPVRVWQAVGVRETTARGLVRDAPLVGRAAELERLLALWEHVQAEQSPALASIVGDPGIGKSRLVAEIAHRAGEDALVLFGRCLSYGEGITYWPVIEVLEGAAGILVSDDVDTVSAKLGALLESLGTDDLDQLRTMASALANLIGVPRTPRGTYSAAQISQAELHWGIRRVLELLSGHRPLVLVFEDLHWAEETLFELLDFLREASGPIMIIGSARRELMEIRPALCTDGEHHIALLLSALGQEESEALLAELLGQHELPPGAHAELLLRNAAGNPLFLEETVRMLAESGALEEGGDLSELSVPTSLQAMIGSRLDGLPPAEKRAAQHASVVGNVFWSGAVADLHGGADTIDPSLEALEGRDFVRAHDDSSIVDEREWGFKHALIKDVAYGRVPKGRRATLHTRFVDWLAVHPTGDELIEIVAYHLEQSCKLGREVGRSDTPPPIERAVEALMRAAEKSERREGIREADRYYARALDLAGDELNEQTLELRLGRAGTLNTLGDLQRSDELLRLVADESTPFGRSDLRAKALIGIARIAMKQGRGSDARGAVAEAELLSSHCDDRALQVRAAYQGAYVRWWFEEAGDAAVEAVRSCIAVAEELEDTALEIEVRKFLQVLLYNAGDLRGAEEQLVRVTAAAAELGSLRDQARATFQLGIVRYHLGNVAEAEGLGQQALDWLERTGDSFYQLQNLRALALCAISRGKLDVAEERLRAALPTALEIGGALLVDIYRILIEVLLGQERLDDARELAVFAFRSVPEEDLYGRAAGLLIEANLRTAEGRGDVARESFVNALELLAQQGLPLDLGEARLAYGRALRRLGDDAAARTELEQARVDLAAMGASGLVDEIDRELGEIDEGAGVAGPLVS